MNARVPLFASLLLSLALLSSVGCKKNESKTTIAGSWRSPQLTDAPFEKLFVIGAGRNDEYRRLYEDSLVAALAKRGIEAQASHDVLPQSEELTEAQIRTAMGAGPFDAVIITSLLHVDQSVEVVEPRTERVPAGQVPGGFGWYQWAYDTVHVPGYERLHTRYNIEARVYRVEDAERIWWGLSETVNPDSVDEIIDSVSDAMASQLQRDGIVR